ncbi:unnamed protein product [Calypogeia fissa]
MSLRRAAMDSSMDCHHTGTGRPPHRHSPPCHLEAPQEALSSAPQEMRVLAVDDNNIDRKLIEMLLKTSSFKVTAVKNAVKALEVLGLSGTDCSPRKRVSSVLEYLSELEYDLIMTDYCMPEMTGYELLRRIKHESSVWKHVPVVIMSSENKPARINRCMAEGAQEFLMKPVKLSDVERLKGYVQHLKETRGDMPSSPTSSSKRKSSSSASLPGQSLERRARLSELTVA